MDNERHAIEAPLRRKVAAILAATETMVGLIAKANAAPWPLKMVYLACAAQAECMVRAIAATPAK